MGIIIRSTTILAVRAQSQLVIVGDGQVSAGDVVLKSAARKIRRLGPNNDILAGFAGATADAFALYEKLEKQIERYPRRLERAAVELAKEWRSDKMLRNLDAMLIVGDKADTLIVTGRGDVVRPDHPVAAIGSGGHYALAAARAMHAYEKDAERIARAAMEIAASICVYTNTELSVEILDIS